MGKHKLIELASCWNLLCTAQWGSCQRCLLTLEAGLSWVGHMISITLFQRQIPASLNSIEMWSIISYSSTGATESAEPSGPLCGRLDHSQWGKPVGKGGVSIEKVASLLLYRHSHPSWRCLLLRLWQIEAMSRLSIFSPIVSGR